MVAQERASSAGPLVLIGGGDYEEAGQIDRYLLERAGGLAAPVAFLPTARPSRRMSEKFVEYYRSLGAENVRVAPVYEREDAFKEEHLRPLREAALIFIGWGTASRLLEVLHGSPAQAAVEEAHQRGAVLACMSAGARAAGEVAFLRGTGLEALREGVDESGVLRDDAMSQGPVQLAPGFNWLPGLAVEVHLGEWQRYGHLLLMAALRPDLTWLGIDERTALAVEPDGRAEVIGAGNLIVMRRSQPAAVTPPRPGQALAARGLRLDLLAHGSTTTLAELRT